MSLETPHSDPQKPPKKRLNIGIIAHVDAGKTSLSEQFFHLAGLVKRPGTVDAGTTVSDWMREEQRRGITITSAAVKLSWKGHDLTLVDTPGHIDFTMELERSLGVLDGAILVISGKDGIEAQTEVVWNQARRAGLPIIAFINKMDLLSEPPEALIEALEGRFDVKPLPLEGLTKDGDEWHLWPLFDFSLDGPERAMSLGPEVGGKPAFQKEQQALEDVLSLYHDRYLEALLSGEAPSDVLLEESVQKALKSKECLPILFGSAKKALGVSALLDAAVRFFPEAKEKRHLLFRDGEKREGRAEELCLSLLEAPLAYVFKTQRHPSGKSLAYVRVFSGALESGKALYATGSEEGIEAFTLAYPLGHEFQITERLALGELGVIARHEGAAPFQHGATISHEKLPYRLEPALPPEALIEVAIEAEDHEQHLRLLQALPRLVEDDPSLRYAIDPQTGSALLSGLGELHLDVAKACLEQDHGLSLRLSSPRVHERTRLLETAYGEGQATDLSAHAEVQVKLSLSPSEEERFLLPDGLKEDEKVAIESALHATLGADVGGLKSLMPLAVKVEILAKTGKAILPILYFVATKKAAERALENAALEQLVPWVRLQVALPIENSGPVITALSAKGATILSLYTEGQIQWLDAEAPLSKLLGFATEFRSLTHGRASLSLFPLGFQKKQSQ